MEDKLKESIENRRQEFEAFEADFDQLWNAVEYKLDKSRFTVWSIVGKVAAAVILTAGLGWMALSFTKTSSANGYALHDISPELAETEYYYSQQVAEKLSIIKASNAEVGQEVVANLMSLDSAYQELKRDLKDNADNEEVVSAMITNYRLKLDILEQILKEIKQHDQQNKDNEANI